MKKILCCTALLVLLSIPVCQATPLTFAQFNLGPNDLFSMVFSTDHNTLTANGVVRFDFLNGVGISGDQQATFTMTATSYDQVQGVSGFYAQGGWYGTFAFTLLTPIDGMSNLLSGTFGGGAGGPYGSLAGFGGSGALGDSELPLGEVTFASDFISPMYMPAGDNAFFISLSSITPGLSVNGAQFYNGFIATGTGTFSANVIPEPVTLVLVGGGLLALGLLRRRINS